MAHHPLGLRGGGTHATLLRAGNSPIRSRRLECDWFANPDDGQLAIYRVLFVFGVARIFSWTIWAHGIARYEWDLGWSGPDWVRKVPPSAQTPVWLIGGAVGVIVCCWTLSHFVLRRVRLHQPLVTQTRAAAITATRASSGLSETNPSSNSSLSGETESVRHHE